MASRLLFFILSSCISFALWTPSAAAQQPSEARSPDALATIRQRYVSSLLPKDPEQAARLRALASRYAASLSADGSWPDIPYQDQGRAIWRAADQLNRALVMAKAARLDRNAGHADAALEAKTQLALERWLDRDLRNPNWWWNEIGIPQVIGEVATLMGSTLPAAQKAGVVAIMKRSNWRRVPWTGANLIWGTEIEVLRGCLEDDPATVAEGYGRMYGEIKIVPQAEEGAQQDGSFHQHGQQLYNGGYGLTYADDLGRFITFSWGTRYQVPADRMALYSAYVLDGMQWMVRGDVIDYSVTGREITRKDKNVGPHDWTAGPVSPAGPAYSLLNVLDMLAAEPTPRQREFRQFAQRLHAPATAPPFDGNKQFWCSDYMVHRTGTFSASVKMLSSRMLNSELVNNEGRKSQHLSDGANFLYLTGNEYRNIFPAWDWTKVPGTTAIQGTLDTGEPNAIGARGKETFAGGVSDGTYGMAAMDLHRGALTAKKAWFFFDDSYLCLGAGITLADDTHSVATDVNQTLLSGPVITGQSRTPLSEGQHTLPQGSASWIFHNHVGYVFTPGDRVMLSNASETGRWSDLGSGPADEVSVPVFNLWIDHGNAPQQGTYQYTVLPAATQQSTAQYAKNPATRVLANDEHMQAAWNDRLQLGMIAFHQPGSLATPAGTVAVDHACLLMIRKEKQAWKISASNPENLALTLHITVGAHHLTMDLPGGNFAGSSITAPL